MKNLIFLSLAVLCTPLFADPTNTVSCSIQPGITGSCSESGPLDYTATVQVSAITGPSGWPSYIDFPVGPGLLPPAGMPGYSISISLDVFGAAPTGPPYGNLINVEIDLPSDSGNWVGWGVSGDDVIGSTDTDPIFGYISVDSPGVGSEAGYNDCCGEGYGGAFEYYHVVGQAIILDASLEVDPLVGQTYNSGILVGSIYNLTPAPEPATGGLVMILGVGAAVTLLCLRRAMHRK